MKNNSIINIKPYYNRISQYLLDAIMFKVHWYLTFALEKIAFVARKISEHKRKSNFENDIIMISVYSKCAH